MRIYTDPWERRRIEAIKYFGPKDGPRVHDETRAFIESVGTDNELPQPTFDWMHDAVYEPLPLPRKPARSLSLRAFTVISVLVVIGVALWAVN